MQINHFINGEFVTSENSFQKLNPFNQNILSTVSNANTLDIIKSIQAGQLAFYEWKDSTLVDRLGWLQKIKTEYVNFKNEIIRSEATDQGLSFKFTENSNFKIGLQIIDRLLIEINQQLESTEKNIIYTPVGLISVFLSWNLSNRLFIERALAAVMAGNTVIVKCSSSAPNTGNIWAQILKKINFPKGVIQFIYSDEQIVKDLLVTHPSVKAISFAGNLKNGSDILKKSSLLSHNHFKKIQISCGGKNPAIVISEPDENIAADVLNSFMSGQGQLAWNSSRLFILEKHADIWKDLLNQYLQNMKPLENIEQDSVWSPMIKKSSVNLFNDIQSLAKSDQAKLIFSNHIQHVPENYLTPTFTKDMSNCSTLQQDQVTAPLFIISEVKYPFDIPKYSNVSYYGFGASLWSELSKGQKIIDQLDVGHVSQNKWFVYNSEPIRAVKQSSFGIQDYRIFGDFFSNAKVLS